MKRLGIRRMAQISAMPFKYRKRRCRIWCRSELESSCAWRRRITGAEKRNWPTTTRMRRKRKQKNDRAGIRTRRMPPLLGWHWSNKSLPLLMICADEDPFIGLTVRLSSLLREIRLTDERSRPCDLRSASGGSATVLTETRRYLRRWPRRSR